MFKVPPIKSTDTRLQELMFSGNSYDHQELSHHQDSELLHEQSERQEENQEVVIFSQNSHTNALELPSEMEFSQSFTCSYRNGGNESGRQMSHYSRAINNSALEKQIAHKDNQLALKDAQIKQLTDFLNKKKKEEGNVNSVLDDELNRLGEQIVRKDILNSELNKKLMLWEGQSKREKKLKQENIKDMDKLLQQIQGINEANNNLNLYIAELNDLIYKSNKRVQILQLQNSKLSEENRRISSVLADNVVEYKPRKQTTNRGFIETSPRNLNSPDLNILSAKHKQEKDRLEQQISAITAKYDELKKRHQIKDKSILELKEQIHKLETLLLAKDKEMESVIRSMDDKNDQIMKVSKQREEKAGEMQRRIKHQKQEIEKKQNRHHSQLHQLAEKNKTILNLTKSQNELKSRILMEEKKNQESKKQIKLLNDKLASQRESIRNYQKQVQSLRGNQVSQQKQQSVSRQLEKQQEAYKTQMGKNIQKLQKEVNQKDLFVNQIKKKLEESQRKLLVIKSKSADQTQLKQAKQQVLSQKQKNKKLLIELKKKHSQIQLLQNKIILLEARVSSQSLYHSHTLEQQQLEDRIQALEVIIQSKNRQIQQLHLRLELHESQQIEKQISQDLINYNMKQLNQNNSSVTISHLKKELSEKYQTIEALKRDLEMKDKSMEFAMQKFLKAEREKLLMEQTNLKLGGTRYNSLEESIEQHYYQNHNPQHQYQILIQRCQTLEERNKALELQIKSNDQSKYKSNPSDMAKQGTNNKLETLMLKNEVKELKEELSKALSDNKRRNNLQKLASFELIELLLEILKRVYKSSEMLKMLNKNTQILELVRRITRREEKDTILNNKRAY